MKIATVKTSRHLALCVSILLATSTFSIAADDGSDGGEPPLSPTTTRRLSAYDPFFEGIKALGSQNLKIDRAVRTFVRENFKGGEPTLDNLREFWSHLEDVQKAHGLSNDAVLRIDTCLNNWKIHLTATSATDGPSTALVVVPSAPRLIGPRSIDGMTPGTDVRSALLRLIVNQVERERRGALVLRASGGDTDLEAPSVTRAIAVFPSAPVEALPLPTIPDFTSHLNARIIGEESAMTALSIGVHTHYTALKVNEALAAKGSTKRVKKENILLCGPTGCGKTASVKALAEKLGKPFFEGDSSGLTRTGYVGESAVSLIEGLVNEAKSMITDEVVGSPEYIAKVIKLVEEGMVLADELDKIAAKKSGSERDIAGSDVQAELLKLSEGKKVTITIKNGSFPPEVYVIDTSKILFIGAGAFTALPKNEDGVYSPNDFIEAGFKPELLGRFGHMIFLQGMTKEKFERILASPDASPLQDDLLLLEMGYGINVTFEEEALKLIAENAHGRETGVRGLTSMVRAALRPLLASSEENRGKTVVVNRAYVEKYIPKVVAVKKPKHPLGTYERHLEDHPEPPFGMYT